MSIHTQSILLRAIQEREFMRVGGVTKIKFNVRIVSASNKDLLERVRVGAFREDFYYRVAVIRIDVPPLRERQEDISFLVEYFVEKYGSKLGLRDRRVSPEAMRLLKGYSWPGNVRELQNMVERTIVMAPGEGITPLELSEIIKDIPLEMSLNKIKIGAEYAKAKESFEKVYFSELLERHNGNITRAAKSAKINPATLHRKISKYLIMNKRGRWFQSDWTIQRLKMIFVLDWHF